MNLPATVTLSRRSGEERTFLIRRCEETDLFQILMLQQRIAEDLSDPGIYVLVDEEDILESLKKDYCCGVYLDGRIVAFTMMIANRVSPRNYGSYVGYGPQRQAKCVSMEITIVDEPCRGFGMQRLFVQLREEAARQMGAEEALVTIGPDNKYSLQNLIDSGYEIIETRPLYEGAMRHILRKDL
ncbi:MAG: hypothetical protein IJ109_05890 [Firmicutes bacterium]|nr:hypothetical protein [Bacillota bacterium]